jgi:CheY-like chemotaxis protein
VPIAANIPLSALACNSVETCGTAHKSKPAGARAYLTKPFDVRELLRILDDLLAE